MSGSVLTGPIPSFVKTATGYRQVGSRVGDTLERIAQRELGNAALWVDLALLNGLAPPWITDDPALAVAGKVLLAGQNGLLVPSTAPPATGVGLAPDIYGIDCLLANGQLVGAPGGDAQTVAGTANLTQALQMRLGTRPGELVYHPKYGNRAWTLLGRGGTAQVNQLGAAWVAASIKADPRVASTSSVTATTTGDVLAVSAIAVAVTGKKLPVGLPGG